MMRQRSKPVRLVLLALVAATFAGCGRPSAVVIETVPADATVWRGEDLLGRTPCTVRMPTAGTLDLRVVHPAYREERVLITVSDPPPGGRLTLELRPRPQLALTCLSVPPGAEVFADGEFRGTTPVRIEGLEPGTLHLVFRAPNRQQTSETVELRADTPEKTVTATLLSLTTGYYRQRIAEAPDDLTSYVDLAHHLMLEKEFAEAIATLETAAGLALARPALEAGRLWSEIDRIITVQFNYGGTADVREAREHMRDMLGRLLGRDPRGPIMPVASYITVLDMLGDRAKAQEIFTAAWRRFPRHRALERLRTQRRFNTP